MTDDDTLDDLTPLPEIAAATLRDVRARFQWTAREEQLAEIVIDALAVRIGRRLGVFDRVLARLADLESARKATDEWRLKLTGIGDENGRLGKMDRRIADLRADMERTDQELVDADASLRVDLGTSEERRDERAAVKQNGSDRKRILAALVFAATVAAGGIYTVRDRYDAAQVARGRDDEWRRHVDHDLDRLFTFFNLPRSTTP